MNAAKQKGMPVKAAAYCRFSSDLQREESIDAQLRAIKDYADRNNMVVATEYIDRAKSATTDNRPEFLQMIKDSAKGEFTIVVVHKLDRFSRNRYDSAYYKRQLKRNGVSIRSVLENIDDSPESILLESVIEGLSEYYSKNLAREVMKGLKENARKGKHTGGTPPLGYDVDKNTNELIINEHEAEAVKVIFKRIIEGADYGELIRELQYKGYKTKRGNVFGKNSIYSILNNEKYIGNFIYNRSVGKDIDGKRNGHKFKPEEEWIRLEGAIPRIVSDEDFKIVQRILKSRMQLRKSSQAKHIYLLSGKVVCGVCGSNYNGDSRKRGDGSVWCSYQCNRRKRTTGVVCRNREISRDYIDRIVLKKLAEYVFSDKYISKVTDEYNTYLIEQNGDYIEKKKAYQKKIKALKEDIDSIVDLLIKTKSETLIGRLSDLEDEKKKLEKELEKFQDGTVRTKVIEEEIAKVFNIIRRRLEVGDIPNKRKIVEAYVDRVVVNPDKVVAYFNFVPGITLDFAKKKECNDLQSSPNDIHFTAENGGEGGI